MLSHSSWCNTLAPLLARSLQLFCEGNTEAWQAVGCKIEITLQQTGQNFIKIPPSALPPLQRALQSGWFDATFPSTSGVLDMLEAAVLAEVAAFRMTMGDWSAGFETLCRGLSAGYPDACACQQPFTMYVEYAMTQHREVLGSGKDADIWVERLKEVFVLQACILR
ncbi:hypothetical protein ABBQ38_003571 [Trebouxia sp. C0009 RCD-2024]